MGTLFDSLSEEIFQTLKGSGKIMTLYDEAGNKTYEPKKSRRLFAKPDNMMISVVEAGIDSEVKLYLSQSSDLADLSRLINTLRRITTRYNVMFNVRKYGRELQPRDFAYQASAMTESSMWGTAKTSYQKFGECKLLIRHCNPILEGVVGARGRNILSMFVETSEGERFKFPANHLSGGRAFSQHINQGGRPHDEVGLQIVQLAMESLQLAKVNRFLHYSRNFLGEEAVSLRSIIKPRIVEIRKAFNSLSGPRGYRSIMERGLPQSSNNLFESTSGVEQEISRLQELLKIDTNHALAESLMPVALLSLGENMTDKINEMFTGVITLEDDTANALVEALIDEYGYDTHDMAKFGNHVAFCESHVFEDARSILDLLEAHYQINEDDAFFNYARDWSEHRFSMSGKDELVDPKEKREYEKSIPELADGLRDIVAGNFEIPEYPMVAPKFTDDNAKHRFYLDLYVSQDTLSNVPTLNYVSSIIDKMADGKKLDAAEKTISGKLIQTLEDDLHGGETDESVFDDSANDLIMDSTMDDVMDHDFDIGDHVATTMGHAIVVGIEGSEAVLEFISGKTQRMSVDQLEKVPMLGSVKEESELAEWFDSFQPSAVLDEVNFDHGLVRPPKKSVPGFDPTIGEGDRVAHQVYGGGKVISTNGKMSKVEFDRPHARLPEDKTVTIMNGALHKVGAIHKVQDSLDPMAEDKKGPCWDGYKMVGLKKKNGRTVPDCVPESADQYDRALIQAFESMDEAAKLPEGKLDWIFDQAKKFAQEVMANPEKHGLEEPFGVDDRDEQEMEFISKFADMISSHVRDLLSDYEIETGMTFEGQIDEARPGSNPTMTYHMEDENTGAEYELEVEYTIDDGSFATGLDYPKFHSYGEIVEIQGILNKTTGEDVDFDTLDPKEQDRINQACMDHSREEAEAAAEYRADARRDARYDESGDIGQGLIDDVKVQDDLSDMSDDELKVEYKNAWRTRGTLQALEHMDAIKAELSKRGQTVESIEESAEFEDLIKNAFFRR